MVKAFYRAGEFKQDILDSRDEILESGFDIGFESAKEFINFKKKFVQYLYAFPFSGKTALMFDIYMHIAKKYKEKIAIYSPEAGGKNFLVAYLVQVYLGKKLHGSRRQKATDKEWEEAINFIDNHFVLLDPKLIGKEKLEFSATEMFNQVYLAEKEYGWKIGFLLCDPYNMLGKTKEERQKTLADFTLESLTYINHVADAMNMNIVVAMHLRDEEMVTDKDTGIEYFRKPHPSKCANGQSVHRVMQIGLGIWRCPSGVIDASTGMEYPEYSTDVFIQKNKVQGAGGVGQFRLYYDEIKQRFYEIIVGKRYYCGEYEAEQEKKKNSKPKTVDTIQPNYNFTKIEYPNDEDNAPF